MMALQERVYYISDSCSNFDTLEFLRETFVHCNADGNGRIAR